MAPRKSFPLAVVVQMADKLTAPMRAVQRRVLSTLAPLNARLRSIGRGLGVPQVLQSFTRLGRRLGNVGRELGALARRAALFGGAAVAAGLAAVRAFARAGDEVAKTADRLGLGIEAYQELRFAADRAGVSSDKFAASMGILVRSVGQAKAGTGPLVEQLGRMSPTLLEAVTSATSTEEAFELVVEAIARVEDPMKKAALAQAAFGRGGSEMINLANGGAAGLAKMSAEARRLGLVIGEDAARGGERFTDSMTDMRAALTGVRNVIGERLLPIVQRLVERLTAFLVDNRAEIAAFVQAWVDRLPGVLADLRARFDELHGRMAPIISVAGRIVSALGPLNVVLGLVAVTVGAKLTFALLALIPAIHGVWIALLSNPIGWILVLVGLLAAGVVTVIKNWEPIKEFFIGLWKSIRETFSAGIDWITERIKRVVNLVPKGLRERFGLGDGDGAPAGGPSGASLGDVGAPVRSEAAVRVEFANLPRGARVVPEQNSGVDLDLSQGYSLATP